MSDAQVFVAADWSAVESWLTAFHSGDATLLGELQAQLAGGPKVHALNAALIYGIAPEDAKTRLVNLKGRMVPAYNGGKRVSHMWNYGAGARQGARTFWLPESFMAEAFGKLAKKYAGVMLWRETLADRVFGDPCFRCPRCQFVSEDDGDCPECTRMVGVPMPLRFAGYVTLPTRVEYTRFGRRRLYEGRRANGRNALTSQPPQSCGASMWNITLNRLHGYDPVDDVPWPSPEGVLRYDPRASWGELFKPASVFVATGFYDSFAVECPTARVEEVARWVQWTMEVPWPELKGWRFPAEVAIGWNLGKFDAIANEKGLKDVPCGQSLSVAPLANWR